MLKDHLGNVRMVLTDEVKSDNYFHLSFEGAPNSQEVSNQREIWEDANGNAFDVIGKRTSVQQLVNATTLIPPTFANSLLVRSSTGKVGAAKLFKVMSGDKIHTTVQYYFSQNTESGNTNSLNTLVSGLVNALANSIGSTAAIKANPAAITNPLSIDPNAIGFFSPQNSTTNNGRPKAFLNVLFFDEQFKFDNTNSYSEQISTTNPGQIVIALGSAREAKKNGYCYIYISNETNDMVYFDNFTLKHERGPILEETHYYPFGLTMAGISSKAAGGLINKKGYNGNELQNKEFSDGSGLELYDFNARTYDQQIGRFIQIDPLSEEGQESFNPYHFSYNNPIRFNDPDGEAPDDIIIRGKNNSSITIKTDLIDISVNAGSIVGDLGGNYTLQGNDILVAASDIVGIVDPTGVADVAAATLEAKAGNWGSAILSGIGVVPLIGDLGKIGKVGKHVKTIEKAIDGAKAKNLKEAAEKGIPNTQLGPSGKPKIHTASKSNLKEAKDAARNNPKSNTSPKKDTKDKGQKTHYHSTKDGEKMKGKDNIHYENRSSKRNPN